MAPACRQEVAEGQEEGVTGRELDSWWAAAKGGWKRDPVEELGEVQLRALLRHKWFDPAAGDSDTGITTRLMEKMSSDKEAARCDPNPARTAPRSCMLQAQTSDPRSPSTGRQAWKNGEPH